MRLAATVLTLAMFVPFLSAQSRMTPTAPGTAGDPVWQGTLKTSDGRTFVTDGGLAIDAALARPAKLPERELPGGLLEKQLAAERTEVIGFRQLAASGSTYNTPKDIPLNATYVDYLRRTLPAAAVRFHMGGELDPIVVTVDGKPVGVMMPVRK